MLLVEGELESNTEYCPLCNCKMHTHDTFEQDLRHLLPYFHFNQNQINTVLTVEESNAGSHSGKRWKMLIDSFRFKLDSDN